jgi:hypothetical protein
VQLAEAGLEPMAADLLDEPNPTHLVDYSLMLRRTMGVISVIRYSAAPARVVWDSAAVLPEALAHLLRALPGWDNGQGFVFENQVSDSTRVFADAAAAACEVERALGLARVANGYAGRAGLSATALSLDLADATGAGLVAAWQAHRGNPVGFAQALAGGVEGFCVLYRLSARGLYTDYIGAGLPSIFGVPWQQLEGVPTLSEPANPDYRDMYVAHVLDCVWSNRPSLYRVAVARGGTSAEYTRLALPFAGPHGGGGVMTYTSNIRGQECLAQLNS